MDSSLPRRRDDPSSGRGKSKRTTTALTTDSDSGSDAPHGTDDGYRYIRQVSPRFYHAPDPDDGTGPSFPPRIARNRVDRRAPPPRPLPAHTPALEPHAQRGPPTVNEDYSPLPTQLLIETITNATLAAVNQPLMSTGLLPRTKLIPNQPHPLLREPRRTPQPYARYTRDSGSPHPPSTVLPTAFDRAFTAKIQAEYRTLDIRRVPRVQPLQFFPHTDRTAATQPLVHSMRDALSGIFDVAGPSGSVTMRSPTWVSGWHAPLLKLTKASIVANRDDTHTLHRLIDDLFAQL